VVDIENSPIVLTQGDVIHRSPFPECVCADTFYMFGLEKNQNLSDYKSSLGLSLLNFQIFFFIRNSSKIRKLPIDTFQYQEDSHKGKNLEATALGTPLQALTPYVAFALILLLFFFRRRCLFFLHWKFQSK
jgi:hypothetical protein